METLDPAAQGFERALVVGAHPDDAEFQAGGTLALLTDAGCDVHLLVCTDGRRGSLEACDDLVSVRAGEQEAAAKLLGLGEIVNLGHPDGELVADETLISQVVREIRRVRPDVVFTHDPETRWRRVGNRTVMGHSDHRATGSATLDAIAPRAFIPDFFPEQLQEPGIEPWMPFQLWLFDTRQPDARVWIDTTLASKLDSLRCHESQAWIGGGLARAAEYYAHWVGNTERPAEQFSTHVLRRRPA